MLGINIYEIQGQSESFMPRSTERGHTGTGPQHCLLLGVKLTHKGDSLWLDATFADH